MSRMIISVPKSRARMQLVQTSMVHHPNATNQLWCATTCWCQDTAGADPTRQNLCLKTHSDLACSSLVCRMIALDFETTTLARWVSIRRENEVVLKPTYHYASDRTVAAAPMGGLEARWLWCATTWNQLAKKP